MRADDPRTEAISRAQVWQATPIETMDFKAGPQGPDAFAFRATVVCQYLPKELSVLSPKFACLRGEDDELKVKYGGTNAEVYGEVAATRLLWALGFGADRMYSLRIVCQGCPQSLGGIAHENDIWVFDPTAVERKMGGREFPGEDGWSWGELELVSEAAGGAPHAHRDALTLLAVFMQHSDTKRANQRLICLDEAPPEAPRTACAQPFMLTQDVGITFGTTSRTNANDKGMNLVAWSSTPVWADVPGCVGNLEKSFTGTLEHPVISEEGRAFLADLLRRLSDAQIRDLFEAARVHLRVRDPGSARSGLATVDEWVGAFKDKRRQIVDRQCVA